MTPAADAAGVVLPRSRARVSGRSWPGEGERRLVELGVLGVMLVWAGNFVVVKAAIAIIPPVGYSAVRCMLAGFVLLASCRWQEGDVGLPRQDVVPLFVMGARQASACTRSCGQPR